MVKFRKCYQDIAIVLKIIKSSLSLREKLYLAAGLKLIIIIGILSVLFFPWALTREFWSFVNYNNTGAIGDTINGIAGPVIALLAAILTFLAFYIQYKANIQQKQQFLDSIKNQNQERAEQERAWKVERFEIKFYELIKLHKENINEMSINGYNKDVKIEKRKVFVSMYNEFKYCFFVIKDLYLKLSDSHELNEISDEKLLELAYVFFYAGVGLNSNKIIEAYLDRSIYGKFYSIVYGELDRIREEHQTSTKLTDRIKILDSGEIFLSIKYKPFSGHQSRLGHYYRHLFQTVKFVVNYDGELISDNQKIEYLRTLRAQLSDHEQVMLYYNAIIGFGKSWIDFGYFTKYKMIHNLPLALADFGLTPQKKFEKELNVIDNDIFEWLQ